MLTKVIAPPDEANRTITVSPAIPAGIFDPTDLTRHTRVRRWDERNLYFGGVQAVARDARGEMTGGGDPRRGGVAAVA